MGPRSVRSSGRMSQLRTTHDSRSRGLGSLCQHGQLPLRQTVDGVAPLPSKKADRSGTGDACALSRQLIRPVYVHDS